MATPSVNQVWADYNADGSVKEPNKLEIRRLLNFMWALAEASGGAKSYPTKAAMDADMSQPDGTVGIVRADPVEANNFPTLWIWEDSTNQWVMGVDRIANLAAAIATLLPDNGFVVTPQGVLDEDLRKIVHLLQDSAGVTPFYTRDDGATFISGAMVHALRNHAIYSWAWATKDWRLLIGGSKLGGVIIGRTEIVEVPGPPGIVFTDREFRALAALPGYPDPRVPVVGADGGGSAAAPVNSIALADYLHIASNGQSLSIGALGTPLISTVQPYGNVMLSGGLRSDTALTDGSFVPLVEQTFTPPGSQYEQGETPISGALNGLVERIASEDGIAFADQDSVFVGSAVGLGGTAIASLDKGSATYQKLLNHVRGAYDLATAAGKSYAFFADMWFQGESDYNQNTSREIYLSLLSQLVKDTIADTKAITRQPWPPLFVCYQLAAHRYYGRTVPAVALAQWDLANAVGSEVRISSPLYIMDYVNFGGDVLHLTNYSYQWLGWFNARLLKRCMDDRLAGRPVGKHRVDVESVSWQGRVIDITYHLPQLREGTTAARQLAFDTTWVSAADNMGYDLRTEDNSIVSGGIASVTIRGRDRVRIVLAKAPNPGEFISYAWGNSTMTGVNSTGRAAGPRGNLRDSAGDDPAEQYTDGGGTLRKGHHWAVIHEIRQPGA